MFLITQNQVCLDFLFLPSYLPPSQSFVSVCNFHEYHGTTLHGCQDVWALAILSVFF